jgi:hypothetical protein
VYNHPLRYWPDTGSHQSTLTLNLNHAGPAIAIRPVSWFITVAQMWYNEALTFGHIPNRLSNWGRNFGSI